MLPTKYKAEASSYIKGQQIFDVWFDTSLTWDFVLRKDAHSDNQTTVDIVNEIGELEPVVGRSRGRSIKAYMHKKQQE